MTDAKYKYIKYFIMSLFLILFCFSIASAEREFNINIEKRDCFEKSTGHGCYCDITNKTNINYICDLHITFFENNREIKTIIVHDTDYDANEKTTVWIDFGKYINSDYWTHYESELECSPRFFSRTPSGNKKGSLSDLYNY